MMCTNCGRPVAGPALSLTVTAEAAVVHEGREFRAAAGQVVSQWLICEDCTQEKQANPLGDMNLPGFFLVVKNDLAKTTGR